MWILGWGPSVVCSPLTGLRYRGMKFSAFSDFATFFCGYFTRACWTWIHGGGGWMMDEKGRDCVF